MRKVERNWRGSSPISLDVIPIDIRKALEMMLNNFSISEVMDETGFSRSQIHTLRYAAGLMKIQFPINSRRIYSPRATSEAVKELRIKIRSLRYEGKTYKEIGETLNISTGYAYCVANRYRSNENTE